MFTRIIVLALSFPRSGLASARGAGAPLLLPEFARSSGREGGKGTKRRGFARPRHEPKGRRGSGRADPRRSCTERAEGEGRKDGETVFSLVRERGRRPLSLLQEDRAGRRAAISDMERAALPHRSGRPPRCMTRRASDLSRTNP
ncbi:hypothetical protein CN140_12410 [Sinorhizobium meliloti]|nr:hypothetical protein CN140_12410 [Sinorhizobium meliloti]